MMKVFFAKLLKVVNNFRKNPPSQMFDRVLGTPPLTFSLCRQHAQSVVGILTEQQIRYCSIMYSTIAGIDIQVENSA